MIMKKLLFAVMTSVVGLALAGEAEIEAKLKSDIMTIVNQVNPIDQKTGQRKYISFGFISDIHKCKRVPGDDATTDPVKDYWYGSASCLTEAEQTIRLLGAVAPDAGLDAIINGGDFSTAPIMGAAKGLTEVEYLAEIWNVKAMFDEHLPASVPLFTVDGNHERCYSLNGALMEMSDSTWANVSTNFNTSAAVAHAHDVDVTYHRDLANAKLGDSKTGRYAGNSFHLDFRRVLKNGGKNVRILCLNAYDKSEGSLYAYRTFDAGQLANSTFAPPCAVVPGNTVMGLIAHGAEEKPKEQAGSVRYGAIDFQNGFMNGYNNAGNKVGPWNDGNPGYGFFGLVCAHFHFTNLKELTPNVFDGRANPDNNVYASAISVASAYADNTPGKSELGTESAYHFSVFVIDTDKNLIREVRVGGWTANPVTHESPVVQLHDFNIRTHLGQGGEEDPAEALDPVAGDNAPAIQSAIDAAAATHGTVVLGEGLFEIQSQLMVTGGVTLVGQGYEKTIVKYTGAANTSASRVATVNGGSTLSRLAITGAKVSVAQNAPGAISISDGTITYCCVTNNYSYQGYGGGIGVNGSGNVKIDHTLVADNTAGTVYDGFGGGIGVRADKGLRLEIAACEVRGNKVGNGGSGRNGAGIGISDRNSVTTVIRDTTVTGNVLTGTSSLGGGLYIAQADTTLTGCTVYGNTAATTGDYFGDADMAFPSFGIESAVAAKSSGNAFATGADADLPVFGTVMVVPSAKGVAFSGVVRAPGTDATACEISLALNGGAAKKIASGVTATFDYDAAGLAPETTYSYTLTLVNNASPAKSVSKSGTFTTRSASDPVQLADYTAYRKYSGMPQSVVLSYYDGPDTRGFAWQTAASVTSGKVWIRKGDYKSADEIVGMSGTVELAATSVVQTKYNCTAHKAHTASLAEGLWSYCLGNGDKTACGQFTVRSADGAITAVNVNDIQTKIASKLGFWGNTIDATCATLPSGFDFILSGGDFIDGSSDVGADDYVQWGVIADTARSKFGDATWIMACGNHESEAYDNGYEIFKELVSEKFDYTSAPKHIGCHVFRQGGAAILTLPYYNNNATVPSAVETWLTEKLAAAQDAAWRIVVMHAGPYTTGDHGPSETFLKQMTPIFAAGKVDLVLQAHDHTYSRTLPYRWTGVGYTQDATDSTVLNLAPATTNVAELAGVPFYLDPEGTFYVSAGCAGHRVGENTAYASGKDVFSFTGRPYKLVTDTVKVGSAYATAGSLGSMDVGKPMFAVLKVSGGLLTYDWYVAETDGSATLFDTLRICKTGIAGDSPAEPVDPPLPPPAAAEDLSNYKWAVIGDSLSDPTLENNTDGPLKYYHYLQQTSGIKVVYTNGVGGTGYKNGYNKDADKLADGGCFYQRLQAHPIPSDVDVVTFFGSINDGGFAETDEDLGTATDSLTDKTTLAAYMNKAIDLARSQAPNAKILLIGGIFFDSKHAPGHVRLNDMLRQIAALRNLSGDVNVAYYDWLTEDPDDPLDFHQIIVNREEEGCFGSLYTYDWKTRGKINESFGHPNPLYNEIWLAPHFGEALTTALKATLGEVTAVPASNACAIASSVLSLGTTDATAADVYLAYGTDANNLGAATKIASGLAHADPIAYTIESLEPGTMYFFELTVSNNAAIATGSSRTGSFVTKRQTSTVGELGDFAKKVVFTFAAGGQPTLVKISEAISGFRYSDCAANGGDVRFADAEGQALPFELVTWNPAGESLVWVKAPAGDGEVAVTMYYSGVPASANVPSDVWSAYTGVWHFDTLGADATQYSQGAYANSTATEGIDAHLSTMSIANEPGRFGQSFRVNDSTGWNVGNFNEGGAWIVDTGSGTPLDADGVFTISGWFKHAAWHYNYDCLVFKRAKADNSDGGNAFAAQQARNAFDNIVQVYGSGSSRVRDTENFGPDMLGDWVYVTLVFNGTSCSVYENGTLNVSGTISKVVDNDQPLVFGNNVNVASGATGSCAWNGWIDEARYTKGVAMTAAQVSAEYAAMANASFVSAGSAQNVDGSEVPTDPTDPDDPDDPPQPPSGDGKQVTFTVNYDGPAGIADIPVLVRLSANSPEGFAYADCASDGSDLRFQGANGEALPFEIDTWNTTGESLIWVKAPSVEKGATFTLKYGVTPSAANTPSATWSGYSGVWHFETLDASAPVANSQGSFANSTASTGIDGNLSSYSTAGETGRFGSCFKVNDSASSQTGDFNKGGVWVDDAGENSPIDGGTTYTISAWFKHKNFSYFWDAMLYKRSESGYNNSNASAFAIEIDSKSGTVACPKARGKGNSGSSASLPATLTDAWGYLTFVYDGNKCHVYENGAWVFDSSITACADNDDPLVFGNKTMVADGGGDAAWNGWIDEARFAKGTKSAEWVAAEYAAMADANFLSAGKVEGSGEEPEPPEEPAEIPVYTLTIPAKTGLVVESVKTNDVAITGAAGAYRVCSNATVTITFAVDGDYEITGGNPVVVTVDGDRTLADGEYPTVRAVEPPPPPPSGDGILPGATPAETRATIQSAIDAAALTQGTVTLAAGLFEIDVELFVTNGVTLAGQGWTNTVVKQTTAMKANEEHRVMTVTDGSTVRGLAITGGNNDKNYGCAGGVSISSGTITDCCVTNNFSRRYFGGGIYVGEGGDVKIDHTVIADNSAGTGGLDGAGGGIGIRGKAGALVEIEACLVYGNTAGGSGRTSPGGGIGVTAKNSAAVVVRNTTVADNAVVGGGVGGGVYVGKGTVTLINCLVAGNTSEATADYGDANVASASAALAPATTTCVIGPATPVFVGDGDYRLAEGSPAIGAGSTYDGIGNDLDGKPFAATPSVGCYEFGSVPPPAAEWDIPGATGGINGLDDGKGGKCVSFTSVSLADGALTVGFEAARVDADGETFALVCKEKLTDETTFTIDVTLTDDGTGSATLGLLAGLTDKSSLFIFGIAPATAE